MKKGDSVEIKIQGMAFPGKSWGRVTDGSDDLKVMVKNGVTDQKLKVRIIKKRRDKAQGLVLEKLEASPIEIDAPCPEFGVCGGCSYMNLPYDKQLKLKEEYVLGLMKNCGIDQSFYQGIVPSPEIYGYRNKMEYTFGDAVPDGPLCLGMHEAGSFYNIVNADNCQIVDDDFGKIVVAIRMYFAANHASYYHKRTHEGFLRHVVLRKGKNTGDILINLVTSSQSALDEKAFSEMLSNLELSGEIVGILHTINDNVADIVQMDELRVLYGKDFLSEKLFDLTFEISTFSFFQTNTKGAEKLYSVIRDYAGEKENRTIFDLYCGTGTIAQVLAPRAKKVIGVELIEEAVVAAEENAIRNRLDNCDFIAGDVLKIVDTLPDKPDIIILDPPRDGIHPKAIFKIIDFKPETFIYVSCKASSLARDLPFFIEAGYRVEKFTCIDLFPHSGHVETVVLLSRKMAGSEVL